MAIPNQQATGCATGQPGCNSKGVQPYLGDLDEPLFDVVSELPSPCGWQPLRRFAVMPSMAMPASSFNPAAAFGPKRGCCT